MSIESPSLPASGDGTQENAAIAVKAVFRMFEHWRVSDKEALILLGRPGRSTFYAWKAGRVRRMPHDTLRRVSYLLGIWKALQILYCDTAQADQWVRRANAAFGGQSALARMLAGDVTDLAIVRQHLDAARGGWA